jgi:hypothetical protein
MPPCIPWSARISPQSRVVVPALAVEAPKTVAATSAIAREVLVLVFMRALHVDPERPFIRAAKAFQHRDVSPICRFRPGLNDHVSIAARDTLGYKTPRIAAYDSGNRNHAWSGPARREILT